MSTMAQSSLFDRMLRAAKVEPALYDEVEHDESATSQALIVVILAALAAAISGALAAAITQPFAPTAAQLNPIGTFIQTLIMTPVLWVVWSYIIYFVGTRFFNGTATPGEMLRAIGFAFTPQILGILSFIPVLGWLISLAVLIWSIWAGIVAVRQGLDVDTGKAVVTVIVGVIVALIVMFIIGLILSVILIPFRVVGG